jgi:hypothetical protein
LQLFVLPLSRGLIRFGRFHTSRNLIFVMSSISEPNNSVSVKVALAASLQALVRWCRAPFVVLKRYGARSADARQRCVAAGLSAPVFPVKNTS